MKKFISSVFFGLSLAFPVTAMDNGLDKAQIISGWEAANGSRMAALDFTLSEGWKTYWRAPGLNGIAPQFDFSGSKNVQSVEFFWPRPVPLGPKDIAAIGYKDRMTLPIRITPKSQDHPIELHVNAYLGVCKDVCMPIEVDLEQVLSGNTRHPKIIASLTDKTQTASLDHDVVFCSFSKKNNSLVMDISVRAPALGKGEMVMVELSDPTAMVSMSTTIREGNTLSAQAYVNSGIASIARSDTRITVVGPTKAVEYIGCHRPE